MMGMEPTGLDEDCRLFRVRKFQFLPTLLLSLNSPTGEKGGHWRICGFAPGECRTRGGWPSWPQMVTSPLLPLLQTRGSHQAGLLSNQDVVYAGSARVVVQRGQILLPRGL